MQCWLLPVSATVLVFVSANVKLLNIGLPSTTWALKEQFALPTYVEPLYVSTVIYPYPILLFGICAYKLFAIVDVFNCILSVTFVPTV